MISEATEDTFRERWQASIPKEFRAPSEAALAPRKCPKPPKLSVHDAFDDFLVAMAKHCGTGRYARLSGPELMAYPGMRPVFEEHKKGSPSQIRHWFAPRHGKPYGGFVLRRVPARKRNDPVRWFIEAVA
jgi:hypothetical protein